MRLREAGGCVGGGFRHARHPEKVVGRDVEEQRDGADFSVAGWARSFFDAVQHALVQVDGFCELPLLHVALDAQVVDAASDVRWFL